MRTENKYRVIFVGPAGGGGIPQNGASAKNYHLLKFFREKKINVVPVDTENWKENPLILIRLAFLILFYPKARFIVAANNMSSYRVLQMISLFSRKRAVIYWVIGGSIADWVKTGKVMTAPFKVVDFFLVEGRKMQNTLGELGFDNTIYVPNFKCIEYIPERKARNDNKIHFVFLSRIIPEKGCDLIIEAVKVLNRRHLDKFCVDFFGPIESDYESVFKAAISSESNISYNGFLDLRNQKNYDRLSIYDVMLFPTHWHGEGFPGVIIDAFVAGLPVIATNWHLNADIIKDGKTGVILKENSVESLTQAMEDIINKPEQIEIMSASCQNTAMDYDIKNVITEELLRRIGVC